MDTCSDKPSFAFGLLSHCDCVFCLECIRNWRTEGVAVAKLNSQVRSSSYVCVVVIAVVVGVAVAANFVFLFLWPRLTPCLPFRIRVLLH